MQRLKRVFAIDIETCSDCGGTLRVIACIEEPALIARILGMYSNAWNLTTNWRGLRPPPRTNVQADLMSRGLPWAASPGAGSAAIRELSHHGLLGARAAAFPAKIPMVQGTPESHLRSETNPRYLSECLKRWLIIPMHY
jgi:hypothetical protein